MSTEMDPERHARIGYLLEALDTCHMKAVVCPPRSKVDEPVEVIGEAGCVMEVFVDEVIGEANETGARTMCPHASQQAPLSLIAYAWDGGLRCETCAEEAAAAMRATGGNEAEACDWCGRARELRGVGVSLPGFVHNSEGEAPWVTLPVTVVADLCRRCWEDDRAALKARHQGDAESDG